MTTVELLFAGDFCPGLRYEPFVLEHGARVLGDARGLIESADLSFVNLECALTTHDRAITKVGPALKAAPGCAEALARFGLVGLANNHIMDFGREGLRDTIDACRSRGIAVAGAGLSASDAEEPFLIETRGVRVAIVVVAERQFNRDGADGCGVALIDPIENYRQINRCRRQSDIVIVTLHAGNEQFEFPSPDLRRLCQYFIEIGADAVIGHHPHVPGAYEYYQEKPIVYSLGNFVFDRESPRQDWNSGYLVRLCFDVEKKRLRAMELVPYRQSIEQGGVKLLDGSEKEHALNHLEGLRRTLSSPEAYLAEWNHWLGKQGESYLLLQYSAYLFRGLGFLARHTPLIELLMGNTVLNKLNMVRCPSHREILVAALEKQAAAVTRARHPRRRGRPRA